MTGEPRDQVINLHFPDYVRWWEGKRSPSALQASDLVVVSKKQMLLLLPLPCRRDFAPYSRSLGKPKAVFFTQMEGSSAAAKRVRSGAWITLSWIYTGCRRRDPGAVNTAKYLLWTKQDVLSLYRAWLGIQTLVQNPAVGASYSPNPPPSQSQILCQWETTRGGLRAMGMARGRHISGQTSAFLGNGYVMWSCIIGNSWVLSTLQIAFHHLSPQVKCK